MKTRSIADQLKAIKTLSIADVGAIDYADIDMWRRKVGVSTAVGEILDDKAIERIDQLYRDHFIG